MAVLIAALFVSALAVGFAIFSFRVLPASQADITLDPRTAAAQAQLEKEFPGIDQAFSAVIAGNNPQYAKRSAMAVAKELRRYKTLFKTAFVPGTGPYYDKYGLLYLDAGELATRVARVLRMQPLYHALGSAPDLVGLAALVEQIGNAVAQGRSPPGLENVLRAAAAAVEGEIEGKPRPIDWQNLAGLAAEAEGRRWFIIADPVAGKEIAAAAAAQVISSKIENLSWSFPPHALGGAAAPQPRSFIVPLLLSVLVVGIVLAGGLGSLRQGLAASASAIVTLSLAAGVVAAIRPDLDAVTWSLFAAVLAPGFLFSLAVIIAFGESTTEGKSALTSVMLAAQHGGPRVIALALLAEVMWLIWLPRQLNTLAALAIGVAIGIAIAAVLALTLVPALLAGGEAKPDDAYDHWLDVAVAEPASSNMRNIRALSALLFIAAAAFCAIFIPSVKFGDAQSRTVAQGAFDTPNAIGAVHIIAGPGEAARDIAGRIGKLPEVGAIRWIEQFMPLDVEPKLNSLRNLAELLPGLPRRRPPEEAVVTVRTFETLEASLKAIANDPATAPELGEAAHRLRRALGLFAIPQPLTMEKIASLESAIFSGIGGLSAAADRLGKLPPPKIADLDPGLRRHFVAGSGRWRIEVLPKSGVSSLSFAAAMRRLTPQAAGLPIVALARNEIVHHEAILALAPALAIAGFLTLAFTRRVDGAIVAMAPSLLALCLCAAAVVVTGQLIDAAALAAVSMALALSLSSSLTLALDGGHSIVSFRAAILPLVVMLGAVAPITLSGNAEIAGAATVASLFLAVAALSNALIGTQLVIWLAGLFPPSLPREI